MIRVEVYGQKMVYNEKYDMKIFVISRYTYSDWNCIIYG
jgi:hypothetical protein